MMHWPYATATASSPVVHCLPVVVASAPLAVVVDTRDRHEQLLRLSVVLVAQRADRVVVVRRLLVLES